MANSKKRKQHKVRPTEYITIGKADAARRENLLHAVRNGNGKVTQVGNDVKLVVGSANIGYIEYLIQDASIDEGKEKTAKVNPVAE